MFAEYANIFTPLEIFMWALLGIVSIVLLWKIFEDEDWPGVIVLIPIFNLIVLGIIIFRVGWWGLRHTLKEVILISILTVLSLFFIPELVGSSLTLSAMIQFMPPSIIGGYLVARKLGCHSYSLYIPAATVVFTISILLGISIFLMVFAIKSLGAQGIHKLVAEIIPGIQDVDADTVLAVFNMGLYVIVLIAIASIPTVFVTVVIGAWIGEKLRLQFSHASPPDNGFMKIDNRVPPRPFIDVSGSINSPLRSRAKNTTEEPAPTEQPAKVTILDKLNS
jgi:hypothetical protein